MSPRIAIDIGIDCGTPPASGFNGNFGVLMPGVVEYRRADLGLSTTGSIVNSWANQSGSAGTMSEHTATVGIGNVGGGLGGRATILQNGTNQGGDYALTLAAPATTNVMFYWIAKSNRTAPAGQPQYLFGDQSANRIIVFQNANSDTLIEYCGSVGNSVTTTHVWARGAALFTGGTTDILKWGNVAQVTGSSAGSAASSTPRTFGWSQQNGTFSQYEWALVLVGTGVTSGTFATTLSSLDTAATSWFGTGNVLM